MGRPRELANLGLGETGVGERRGDLVPFGGALAGTVVAQVVHVHAVNDVAVAALAADFVEAREELVLAVEAAVGRVAEVVGVVEFVGLDVLVRDSELRDEGFGVALVRFGKGSRVGGDGDGVGT